MIVPKFIHLRVHSHYSIIDGLAKIKTLVDKAKKISMPALAITDFNNLYGTIKFYKYAHESGIKPILGVDILISINNNKNFKNITLLAMNDIGYRNIKLLISLSYKNGYNNKIGPVLSPKWLLKLNKGIIILSGGISGEIGTYLLKKDMQSLERCINFYKKYFKDQFYIEISRTKRKNEEIYLNEAIYLSYSENIPLVATNEVCFSDPEDFEPHNIRVSIYNRTLDIYKHSKTYSKEQYFKDQKEMCELFADVPAAIENSVEIAKRCNVLINLKNYFLPKFSTGKINEKDYLIISSKKGLEKRLNIIYPDFKEKKIKRIKYDKRLNEELNIINKMGFPGYFLIVMEFIQWAKKNNITVGPGRGSGAGSLVAYALKITEIDPLKFNLLFERFLNTERITMPDFDIDFCINKRDKVIQHVSNTYGSQSVSQIITFGSMAAKAAIRDVGRILGYPYPFVEKISKLVPKDIKITLEKALKIEHRLQELYKINKDVQIIIDMAKKLEGTIRNIGKHAGGVVISPTKITDYTPLYYDKNGKNPVTQFDKDDIEYIGLVKFDFLGLRTLTIINLSLKMINQYQKFNKKPIININHINLNDKNIFNNLKFGSTKAIFQLESHGIKELIKRLQPDCFEDLIALIALFRPGPLQSGMVDNFINRKHKLEKIFYPDKKWQHPLLKNILKSTYGIILYQEQVMQIAQVLAGYTLGAADILRRAMGKKNPIEMAKQRAIFEKKSKLLGIDGKLSVKIFDLMEKFAGYGFNKSHSTAYALISYQTLWLKKYYPAEFMSSVMSIDIEDNQKIVSLIQECKNIGLKVLIPNINIGLYNFYVYKKNTISYGIGAIKGIGKETIKHIILERKKGNFKSLLDFCNRIGLKKITRNVIEKLIFAGTFDSLEKNRALLISNLDNILKISHQNIKSNLCGQIDMFGKLLEQINLKENFNSNMIPWEEKYKLKKEKEVLGFYLSRNPIEIYSTEIKFYLKDIIKIKNLYFIKEKKYIKTIGLVVLIKNFLSKKGNQIEILTLDDGNNQIEVILYKETLMKYKNFTKKDEILIVSGYILYSNINDKNIKLVAQNLIKFDDKRQEYIKKLIIFIERKKNCNLNSVYQVLRKYQNGIIPVYFYEKKKNKLIDINLHSKIHVYINNDLLNKLIWLLGNKQVKLEYQ